MKKISLFLLAFFAVFALSSCFGNGNPTTPADPTTPVETTTPADPTTPVETTSPEIDLSGILFEDEEFEYTGSEIIIEAFYIPDGVVVEYQNNVLTEIGDYEVTAVFKDNNGNILLEKTITISIVAAAYELYFMSQANGWSANPDFQLSDMEDGNYEYTVELVAGDQFKIASSDWQMEYGISGLFGNFAAFAAGSEEDGTPNSNVMVKEDGIYTFIINPDENSLVVEKDGIALEKINGTVYYVKGELNGWSCNPAHRFVLEADNKTATVTVELKANQQFKISDEGWTDSITYGWSFISAFNMEQFAEGSEYGNVRCLADGVYKFTITNYTDPYKNFAEQVLTVEIISGGTVGEIEVPKYEYYIRGSLNGWLDDQSVDVSAYKLVVEGDKATIEVQLAANDEFKLGGLDWSQGNLGFNALIGDNIEGNFADNNGNIKVLNAGLYIITINGYGTISEKITITPVA